MTTDACYSLSLEYQEGPSEKAQGAAEQAEYPTGVECTWGWYTLESLEWRMGCCWPSRGSLSLKTEPQTFYNF